MGQSVYGCQGNREAAESHQQKPHITLTTSWTLRQGLNKGHDDGHFVWLSKSYGELVKLVGRGRSGSRSIRFSCQMIETIDRLFDCRFGIFCSPFSFVHNLGHVRMHLKKRFQDIRHWQKEQRNAHQPIMNVENLLPCPLNNNAGQD